MDPEKGDVDDSFKINNSRKAYKVDIPPMVKCKKKKNYMYCCNAKVLFFLKFPIFTN